MRLLSSEILYFRIKHDWLSVKVIGTNTSYEDVPLLAIMPVKGQQKIVAVGKSAEIVVAQNKREALLLNPFDHPRTIISDPEKAERAIQYFKWKVLGGTRLSRPVIVLHPLEKVEGGLTRIEAKALKSAGEGAGAKKVYVWAGRELTEQEIMSNGFTVDKFGFGGEKMCP